MPIEFQRTDNADLRRIGQGVNRQAQDATRDGMRDLGRSVVEGLRADSPVKSGRYQRGNSYRLTGRGDQQTVEIQNDAAHAKHVERRYRLFQNIPNRYAGRIQGAISSVRARVSRIKPGA